jgi:hypothetical protein
VAADPQEWMVYFSEIDRLASQPVITRAEFERLQRDTDHFLGITRLINFYQHSTKIAELLKRESAQSINFDVMIKRDAQIEQPAVKNFLTFIKNSTLNYPEATPEFKLADLYENLKVMMKSQGGKGEKDVPFYFVFGNREFKYYPRQWNDLLNRSRMSLLIRDFVGRNPRQDGLLFFSTEKEFEDIVLNASNDGRFMFTGHARIDGRFTREAVEKKLKPVLTELPPFIETLPVPQKDKSYFLSFLRKEVDIYGRRYAQYYRKYYSDFDIKATSPGALRFVLGQMVLPSSPLMEVLLTIRDNTRIDSGKNDYLQSLAFKLMEFEFVQRLMTEQKGAYPELDKYKILLEQMQMDMQDQPPAAPTAKKDKDEPAPPAIKAQMTPLGRIAFAIFTGDRDSYVNMVKLWLNSVGIPRQWQDIFLAPVWQAYFLGMAEMQGDINKVWGDLRQTTLNPLYGKFPFEMNAGEDVSIEALKNATHPQGQFWQTFQKCLTPFCYEEGGRWRRRAGPHDLPKLPVRMLETANALAQLSAVLWDKDGKERPLDLTIKAGPMPSVVPGEPIAVLSYLQVGDSAVLGFNQKPAWKKLKFQWQNQSWASVGVECVTTDKKSRIKRSIEIATSYWSIYHLLKRAEEYGGKMKRADAPDGGKTARRANGWENGDKNEGGRPLTWIVKASGAGADGKPMELRFMIQGDPWAPFRLPH